MRAGTGGAINAASSHNVNLIIDINGYFTDDFATPGLLYYPINPCRAVDTRGPIYSSPRQPPYGNQRIQAQENRSFRLPGNSTCQLPAAAAYSMLMTLAPGDTTSGLPVAYITAYPTGVTRPEISNMNSIFGYAVANSGIVPAGTMLAFLSMWPTGTAWPNISQLNAFEGQTVANSGIVPASANGSIDVRVLGTTPVVLEVSGYFGR